MKKTIIKLGILVFLITILVGCDNHGDKFYVTTTSYPIEYIITRLYGNSIEIKSIYPNDSKVSEYKLTEKQIKEYSKTTDLFVYNGLTDEKQLAKNLITKNKNIQIIDATYGIKYYYGIEELWLNPNNYLTLASTIKNELKEINNSKYKNETIEENYNVLREELAKIDANLRSISKNANNSSKKNIVIASESLAFLKDYGFNIINISDENSVTGEIKAKFKNKEYTYILLNDTQTIPSYIQDIIDNYGTELISVNTMETLKESERANNENYLTIMNDFLKTLSNKVNN